MKAKMKMTTSQIYYECEEFDWEPRAFKTFKGLPYSKIAEEIVESLQHEFSFQDGEIVQIDLYDGEDEQDRICFGEFNVVVHHISSYTAHLKNP